MNMKVYSQKKFAFCINNRKRNITRTHNIIDERTILQWCLKYNKNALTAVFRLALLRDWIEKWGGDYAKQDLLAKGFLLPTLSTSILFTCFWNNLVRVYKYTKIQRAWIPDKLHHCQSYLQLHHCQSYLHGTSFQSSPKINRMLITRAVCIQWKFTTRDHRSFAN